LVVPMVYYAGGYGSGWDSDLQWWIGQLAGADAYIVPGLSASLGYDSLVAQTEVARLRGAAGNSVFSFSSFPWWDYYEQGIYSQPVDPPALPWKDNPTLGIVYGYITAPDGSPVTDARVEWSGQDFITLSSADGFYSLLKVTPGTHTVTASHPGYLPVSATGVSVSAGQVARQDIAFEVAPPPGDFNGDFVVDQADMMWMLFCLGGPGASYNLDHFCADGDADGDWDVDIVDLQSFQLLYAD
ncbi:MAG: carboxypeptidase regulatory-like domain-containing protein, partial [Phycisphaerae bacterium]|nr:carboxypeptidase regulatory-like domain-containing protein [Phycisphaerae bacterium]